MHPLAQRVLSHIRRQGLLKAGDRVGVAVSGGIDSVALLRLLLELRAELGIVLSVVHFNHMLRGAESDADEEFVAALARILDLEFFCDNNDVAQQAADEHVSVEAAARELRYGFFRHLIQVNRFEETSFKTPTSPKSGEKRGTPGVYSEQRCGVVDKIVTAHTLDDQAETVLMHMIRGTGLAGLGGIHPRILVEDDDGEICGEIVRPLLAFRRRELEQYLREIGQGWREDSTNADPSFTRNRVRKLVTPLLEKEFNPSVAENLAELAEIARGEEDYWENEVAGWMGTVVHWSEPDWANSLSKSAGLVQISAAASAKSRNPHFSQNRGEVGHPNINHLQSKIDNAPWLIMNAAVDRLWFLGEPTAVQRRLVKAIGEEAGIPLTFKHVEEILHFAARHDVASKELSLPLGWKIRQEPNELIFVTPDLREPIAPQDYEYKLSIPGTTNVLETETILEVRHIPSDAIAGYNIQHLLDAESLPGPLMVRNWRPGDRFWPAHTKSPKKIKELLQERHIAQPERKLWPVIVTNKESCDEIVWLRGFPAPAKFQVKPGRAAILITEKPLIET